MNIFHLRFVEPDNFFKLDNRTCKNPVGNYATLAIAMSKCSENGPCFVVDDGCDDRNKFNLCPDPKDLVPTSEATCTYHKGLLCL